MVKAPHATRGESRKKVEEAEEKLKDVRNRMADAQKSMQETAEELEKLQEAVLRPLFEKKQVDKFEFTRIVSRDRRYSVITSSQGVAHTSWCCLE